MGFQKVYWLSAEEIFLEVNTRKQYEEVFYKNPRGRVSGYYSRFYREPHSQGSKTKTPRKGFEYAIKNPHCSIGLLVTTLHNLFVSFYR